MPQHHMVIPHYMWGSREVDIQSEARNNHKDMKRVDSFSSWSSNQDLPLLIPQEGDGPDSSDEDLKLNGLERIHDVSNYSNRKSRSPFSFRKPKIETLLTDLQMKGFADNRDHSSSDLQGLLSSDVFIPPSTKVPNKEWWEPQELGELVSADEARQVGPRVSCRCQVGCSSWIGIPKDHLICFVGLYL